MAIDFPNSPTVGELYTVGDITRRWDGVTWSIVPTTIQGVTGPRGIQGQTGIQGTQGLQGVQGPQGTQGIQGTSFTSGFTAKGQILVGTGVATFVAETVGANNQLLIADSVQADGVRWGDDYAIMQIMGIY